MREKYGRGMRGSQRGPGPAWGIREAELRGTRKEELGEIFSTSSCVWIGHLE